MRALVALLLAVASHWPAAAWAEITQSIRFESTPPGAQVFLLSGTSRTPVGTTPVAYEAEFHSEVSILRFAFARAGYEESTLEVGPGRDRVVATLKPASVVADADKQQDPRLRRQQEQITPAVTATLREAFAKKGTADAALDGPARLKQVGDAVFLVVPVSLQSTTPPGSAAEQGAVAQGVWRDVASDLSNRLRSAIPASSGVAGVIVSTAIKSGGSTFSVNSRVESKTEIACIPGTVMVYNSCATMAPVYETSCYNGTCNTRQSGTRCAPGSTPQFSPCATQGPVTKFELKTDPQVGFRQKQVQVFTVALFPAKGAPGAPGLLHVDANGKVLFEQGAVPTALKAELTTR
ncbi:hypothetical protein BH10PSE17_BH10PSE17_28790 [soil metagenome]